ncbi:MAG: lysozyme inhibitor LprI family protein [Pseudomonadota bacterium]
MNAGAGWLAVAAALLAAPAAAEPPPDCAGTTRDMTLCAANALEDTEARMADALAVALDAAYDDDGRALVAESQSRWITFRDSHCAAEADQFRGGTIASMIAIGCRDGLTEERIAQLRALAVPIEGDPGEAEIADAETFWGVTWGDDFDRDGAFDDARLGVRPTGLPDPALQAVLEVRLSGRDAPLRAEIPVDGGGGLCGPPLPLRVEPSPTLVVEDGLCDAFRFTVEGDPPQLLVDRN